MSKPLAFVAPVMVNGRIETYEVQVNGGRVVARTSLATNAADIADAIDKACAAVVEPLQALLSQALAALADVVTVVQHVGPVEYESAAWHHAARVLNVLRTASPGEWVPLEKYKQLEAVLADALEFTEAKKWRERCERALAKLREWEAGEPDPDVVHLVGVVSRVLTGEVVPYEGREVEPDNYVTTCVDLGASGGDRTGVVLMTGTPAPNAPEQLAEPPSLDEIDRRLDALDYTGGPRMSAAELLEPIDAPPWQPPFDGNEEPPW